MVLAWSSVLPATSIPFTSSTSSLTARSPVPAASPPGTSREMKMPTEDPPGRVPSRMKKPSGRRSSAARISWTRRCVGGTTSTSTTADTRRKSSGGPMDRGGSSGGDRSESAGSTSVGQRVRSTVSRSSRLITPPHGRRRRLRDELP